MPTATKIAIIAAGLMFDVRASDTSGDAPWCAVTEIGEGAEAWDCQYPGGRRMRAKRARRQSRQLYS
jgi:hypothetical protein